MLAHADVFAMPSVYEELGTAVLEAMAAGLAIVAADTGGIPGAVGDAALLVPPADPAALASAIDGVLADPRRARVLRSRAAHRARAFDWDALADRVLSVYRRVRR